MLRMRDHDGALREELQQAADEAGVEVWRGLRLGAGATDALPAMRAGYPAACLAACTDLKVPANYHWPTRRRGEPGLGDDRQGLRGGGGPRAARRRRGYAVSAAAISSNAWT